MDAPMTVVTSHVGPRDKAGIMIGQVLEPCPASEKCEECASGKVKILGRSYYGVVSVRHIDPSHFKFTPVR
jgi:hypothetical protein